MHNQEAETNLSDPWILPRREVLKRLAQGAALGTLGGNWLSAAAQETTGEEAFWGQVRKQFPIRPGLIMDERGCARSSPDFAPESRQSPVRPFSRRPILPSTPVS